MWTFACASVMAIAHRGGNSMAMIKIMVRVRFRIGNAVGLAPILYGEQSFFSSFFKRSKIERQQRHACGDG